MIKELEKLNQAKLPKKYHNIINEEVMNYIQDIKSYWNSGDRTEYNKLSKYIFENKRSLYYILFIWFHPLTRFQQLSKELEADPFDL